MVNGLSRPVLVFLVLSAQVDRMQAELDAQQAVWHRWLLIPPQGWQVLVALLMMT